CAVMRGVHSFWPLLLPLQTTLTLFLQTQIVDTLPADDPDPLVQHPDLPTSPLDPLAQLPTLIESPLGLEGSTHDLNPGTRDFPLVWDRLDSCWGPTQDRQVIRTSKIIEEQNQVIASLQERLEALDTKLQAMLCCCPKADMTKPSVP
ncbi:hypothetical protein OTU49_000726, partial [Cherax quadricarinatus]